MFKVNKKDTRTTPRLAENLYSFCIFSQTVFYSKATFHLATHYFPSSQFNSTNISFIKDVLNLQIHFNVINVLFFVN